MGRWCERDTAGRDRPRGGTPFGGPARRRDRGHGAAGRKPLEGQAPPSRATHQGSAGDLRGGADPRHDRYLRRALVRPESYSRGERRAGSDPRRREIPIHADASSQPRDGIPRSTMLSTMAKISSSACVSPDERPASCPAPDPARLYRVGEITAEPGLAAPVRRGMRSDGTAGFRSFPDPALRILS